MIPKQYRIHVVLMLSVIAMIVYPMLTQIPDETKEKLAAEAATEFLERVDAEQYDQSWQMSSALLREKISREEWAEKLASARARFGTLVSRELKDSAYSKMAQENTEGEFIVLTYDSKFKQVESVTETVTVMLEKDARWRVAGYFLQ